LLIFQKLGATFPHVGEGRFYYCKKWPDAVCM